MARFILKLIVASGLVYWLISTKKLDFGALELLWQNPMVLSLNVLFWLTGSAVLCSLRWRVLVHGLGFTLPLSQAIRLNLIGLFFNTIMPGAVGGDVIKALYVCRGQSGQAKVPVFLSILLDRVMGLLALFTISSATVILNFRVIYQNPALRPFIALSMVVPAGGILLLLLVAIPQEKREKIALLRRIFQGVEKIRILRQVCEALQSYKDSPSCLMKAFLLATTHQILFLLLYLTVCTALLSSEIPPGILMTILPIGIVSTACL